MKERVLDKQKENEVLNYDKFILEIAQANLESYKDYFRKKDHTKIAERYQKIYAKYLNINEE